MTIDDIIDWVERRTNMEKELAELDARLKRAASEHEAGLYQGESRYGSRVLQIVHVAGGDDAILPTIHLNLADHRMEDEA